MTNPEIKPQKLTPASLGFSMPAEWEAHAATWLSWPHNEETWPVKRLFRVEETYLQMLEALLPQEKVHLLIPTESLQEDIFRRLKKRGVSTTNFLPHIIPTIDTWIRDYGPTFIKNKTNQKAWCKWIFNAWGNKYESLAKDTNVFEKNANLIKDNCFKAPFILEGGSIEVNGEGICLTTEQCLLNQNRNPQFSRTEIEQNLRDYLGVSEIVWLEEGIVGDDTDGHIDDFARFVSSSIVVISSEDNARDENHLLLARAFKRLEKRFDLVKLPMPSPVIEEGTRLPASYTNFYLGNGVLLLPTYEDKFDERAEKILGELFPKRKIVPIQSCDLVYGLGSIHCVTQQEPE